MTPRIILVLTLGLFAACTQRWSPTLERVRQECGNDIASASRYVKVLDPDGGSLETSALYDVRASLRKGPDRHDLTISSRGCLAVPADEGQIELQVLKKNWAAVENLSATATFQTLKLRATEPLKITLNCPSEGYWAANQTLRLPLQFESASDPSLFEIDLRAVDDQGHETSLYAKPIGEKTWNADVNLDLSRLDEKLYTLVTYQKDLSRQTSLVASRGCPLAILRRRPIVDGLRQQGPQIVKQGTILPWTMPQPDNARLHVCREPYASETEINGSCQPVSNCKDPSAFRVENLVRAEKAGLWKYFVYAADAAQNRSDLSCQSLIISADQPSVQIKWRDPEWNNKTEPLMKMPTPLVSLDISTFHPTIPSSLLEPNLTCKVEFLGSGWTHAGKEALCLNGACKGLTLENFQPCSPELDVNIGAVLNDASLLDARMRVTVRVQDGAGGEAEASRQVWLRKSLWGFTAMQPPGLVGDDLPWFEQIVPRPEEQLLGSTHGQTYLYQNEQWRPLPTPFEGVIQNVNFIEDPNHQIIGRFRIKDEVYSHDRFAVLQKDRWQALTIEGWPENHDCDVLTTVEDGTLLCANLGTQILFNQEKVLDVIPQQDIDDNNGCYHSGFNAVGLQNRDKIWYVPCDIGVLTRGADGHLMNIILPVGYATPADESYEFDGQGRLWMILQEGIGEPIRMGYVQGTTFTEVPSPIPVRPAYDSLTFARNERGDIQFQQYVWSDADQKWLEIDAIRQIFPTGSLSVRRLKTAGGLIYETAAQALIQQNGRQVLVPKRGLSLFKHEASNQAIIQANGTVWMTFPGRGPESNTLRMRTSSFIGWGSSAFNIPKEGMQALARNDADELVVRLFSGAFYQFDEAHWTLLAPNPDFLCSRTFIEGHDIWCGGNRSLIAWNATTQTWGEVWRDNEEGQFSSLWLQSAEQSSFRDAKGRHWFVKYDGTVVTEFNHTWSAFNPIQELIDEDDMENVEIADLVDGRFVMITRKAIYWENGSHFLRQAWADLGYQDEVVYVGGLGNGIVRLEGENDTIPSHIVDLRRPDTGRAISYKKEVLEKDEVIRASRIDPKGRLILVTSQRVVMEMGPAQWSTIVDLKEIQTRFGNSDLYWDRSAFLDADARSLWINVTSTQLSEVVQILLP